MDCNLRMFLENRLGWTRLVNNVDVLNMMVLIYDYTIPSFNCEQKIIYIYPCIVNSVEEIKRVFLSKRVCFNFIRRKKITLPAFRSWRKAFDSCGPDCLP